MAHSVNIFHLHPDDPEDPTGKIEEIVRALGPNAVDKMMRQALLLCWLGLPRTERSVEKVTESLTRAFNRMIDEFRQRGDDVFRNIEGT